VTPGAGRRDSLTFVNDKQPGDPAPKAAPAASTSTSSKSDSTGLGIGLYAILLIGGVIGYGAFQYLAKQQEGQQTA